jgi:hypothetical protein
MTQEIRDEIVSKFCELKKYNIISIGTTTNDTIRKLKNNILEISTSIQFHFIVKIFENFCQEL